MPSQGKALQHDVIGRSYGHEAKSYKVQLRMGLRVILHLSKPYLAQTFQVSVNHTDDGFQYVGIGVGEQFISEQSVTQIYVNLLDIVY